ncbi:MAG: hypothetical protein K2X47_00880 [Bdellovibrionales bacterium]|nr:hypothetical protein [Bdellovibrionales bacterium]
MRWHSKKILKLHGFLLMGLGGLTCVNSVIGFHFSKGPFQFLGTNEVAAVGFIEAYGLAFLLGASLTTAAAKSARSLWHMIAAIAHLFLFIVNIRFWHLYEPLNLQPAGFIATGLHLVLIVIEATCFVKERRNEFSSR